MDPDIGHGGAAPAPRLLDQVRDTIRRRHYSYRTEETYVHWIRRYILFLTSAIRAIWQRRT